MVKLLGEQGIKKESGQVLLRSKLRAVSRRMAFPQAAREKMELVCNEMMSNQLKFAAGKGLIQLWAVEQPCLALDLFALDYGEGFHDLPQALTDGYTTAGTMGKGLGAIRRLAHQSEFYSLAAGAVRDNPWHGMAVWARFYRDGIPPASPYQIGCYLRAYHDGIHNGDAIWLNSVNGSLRWLHMDGLGHGQEAAEAVRGCNGILYGGDAVEELLTHLSQRLKGGRGAVGMLVEVDSHRRQAGRSGVGDMSAFRIADGERTNIMFKPGILGHAHGRIERQTVSLPPQALLITASDGLRRSWSLRSFPGLWRLHPQLIALLLGAVAGRDNDDRSILALRITPDEVGSYGYRDTEQ